MVGKFHIGKRGTPSVCKAKGSCPLGGEEIHGESREEVQAILDSYYETEKAISNNEVVNSGETRTEISGQLKAVKERMKSIESDYKEKDSFNKKYYEYRDNYSDEAIKQEKEILDNNSKLSENYEKLQEDYLKQKTEQNEIMQKYRTDKNNFMKEHKENYNKEVNKLIQSSHFYKEGRIKFTEYAKNKIIVNDIQKNEWNEYNRIKDGIKELDNNLSTLSNHYDETHFPIEHNKELKAPKKPLSENEYNERLNKYKDVTNVLSKGPEDLESLRSEYNRLNETKENLEQKYKEVNFKDKTGYDYNDLSSVKLTKSTETTRSETSDKIRVDENGNYTNVFTSENERVLGYNKESNRLTVEDINTGTQKEVSLQTNWNWRQGTAASSLNKLPEIKVAENSTNGKLIDSVTFVKLTYDSSD